MYHGHDVGAVWSPHRFLLQRDKRKGKRIMSTRSIIARVLPNGQYQFLYCHWDGYPSHNGRILLSSYTTQEKQNALFALGDLSVLGEEIGEKHIFDRRIIDPNWPHHDWCCAYGRDRGEAGIEAKIVSDREELELRIDDSWAEFAYFWDGETWFWRQVPGYKSEPNQWKWQKLTEAVVNDDSF